MYIEGKYWNNYIGDTDDSLTLVEYLASKQKKEISVGEILNEIGFDQLNGDFRQHEQPLTVLLGHAESDDEQQYAEFYYAIDIISDLAALILECRVNGSVNLCELAGYDLETDDPDICITAAPEEHELINKALMNFAASPLDYDVSELAAEEDIVEMAAVCEQLRKELYSS